MASRDDHIRKMCELMFNQPVQVHEEIDSRVRALVQSLEDPSLLGIGVTILGAAMYAAKTTLPKGSWQRVYVQDLAAALNRRRLLDNDHVEAFTEEGYQYFEDQQLSLADRVLLH